MLARVVRAALVVAVAITLAVVPAPSRADAPAVAPSGCAVTHPYDPAASLPDLRTGIETNWGFRLTGTYWTDERYRPIVAVIWRTLDTIGCTPYLDTLHAKVGVLELSATSIGGWPAGDYGLTRADAVSLDFPQLLTSFPADPGHVSRLFVHEITHAYTRDRSSNPAYWTDFLALYSRHGRFGSYGGSASETFSEVVGYFVARCAAGNPYLPSEAAYYDFVKNQVFGGTEFGPALGQPVTCEGNDAGPQGGYESAAAAVRAALADREAAAAEIAANGAQLYGYESLSLPGASDAA
ncbi:MAG TPA: hypothetical protein VFK68_09395 [Propionibacteriaceae bacterium]|nr:hypothetical protein [Propionibacteriaceae bacterium]